jgi:hypothetical protein
VSSETLLSVHDGLPDVVLSVLTTEPFEPLEVER